MKRSMLFTLFLVLYLHGTGQVRLGVIGGAVMANTSEENGSKNSLGVFLGMATYKKLSKSVSLRPQLRYTMKGGKLASGEKATYNYLELPVNFVYDLPTTFGRFSFGGGPVFAYMTSGAWTAEDGIKEKISFEIDEVNRVDYGLNVVTGFEVKGGVFFNLNYTLGLANVWSAERIGANKNRSLGLGVGVMF